MRVIRLRNTDGVTNNYWHLDARARAVLVRGGEPLVARRNYAELDTEEDASYPAAPPPLARRTW